MEAAVTFPELLAGIKHGDIDQSRIRVIVDNDDVSFYELEEGAEGVDAGLDDHICYDDPRSLLQDALKALGFAHVDGA